MRQRQPDVQRNQAGLDAQADQQQHDHFMSGTAKRPRRPAHRPDRASGTCSAMMEKAMNCNTSPSDGQGEIDASGPLRGGLAVVHHQHVGGETHQGEAEVERGDVLGQDQSPKLPAWATRKKMV
jgi:hypothetical protein